jgi:hypothetical protein
MARTFINQSTQIANSETYTSNEPTGSAMESQDPSKTLATDLANLRTLARLTSGEDFWHGAPIDSIRGLHDGLATEVLARTGQGTTLNGLISDEVTARKAADVIINTAISDEVTARGLAEGIINGTISALDAAYKGADTTLTTDKLARDGSQAMTSDFNAGSFRVTKVALPTQPSDATNKSYVDALVSGLKLLAPVRALASTVNGAFIGTIVDGVQLVSGDSVLAIDADPTFSGPYIVTIDQQGASWARRSDFSATSAQDGAHLFVQDGGVYGDTGWVQTSDVSGSYLFSQLYGVGTYTAGAGLDLSGREFLVEAEGIVTAMLASSSVTEAKIDNLAVTEGKLGGGAVATAKIADLAVTTAKIAVEAVTAEQIGKQAVTTAKIDGLAVTTAKIDDLAVTTAKIGDLAVTAAKLGASSVTTVKVEDSAITQAKLGLVDPVLAQDASTKNYTDLADALKFDKAGGTVTGTLKMSTNQITGLGAPTLSTDAATLGTVTDAIAALDASLDARTSKTYAVLTAAAAAGVALVGGFNGNLDATLPTLPSDPAEFNRTCDVYLNGQLLRSGADMDVQVSQIANAVQMTFPAVVGDVLCIAQRT